MRTSKNQLDANGKIVEGFDYDNQAWIKGGVYMRCGHPESMQCSCFGRIHEGEPQKFPRCATCEKEVSGSSLNGYGDCSECCTAKRNAKHFTKDFDLRSGDAITIRVGGSTYSGTVLRSDFWGEHDGWYVEFTHNHGGYGYWKQGVDGGTIAKAGL